MVTGRPMSRAATPVNTHSPAQIFDTVARRNNRMRCEKNFQNYNFLFDWSEKQLLESLKLITRPFPSILVLGARATPEFIGYLKSATQAQTIICADIIAGQTHQSPDARYVECDEEILPFAKGSFDLVISNLSLHSMNDLPGTFIQLRHILKADGLLMAALLGGETLYELRKSLMDAELSLSNGISPRIFPFAGKQDIGALLQRAGYALPVIDSDIVTVSYENIFKLMNDLRGMGEGNIIRERRKTFSPRRLFLEAATIYHQTYTQPDGRLPASFEIIFLHGWAPHESQQKPLRPGSAKSRLADFLGEKEEKL